MGWTCQHDEKGFCKLLKILCQPGIKGCTINKSGEAVFTTGYSQDEKEKSISQSEEIDFSELARSH